MTLTIDKRTLNASSGIESKILKCLKGRGKNSTYLSKELGKSKSTVLEHLTRLESKSFVEREEKKGRREVIYSLTLKGEGLLRPERIK